MKLLWVANTIPLSVFQKLNIINVKPESWLVHLESFIKSASDIELVYMFSEKYSKAAVNIAEGNVTYRSYPEKNRDKYEKNLELYFENILRDTKPDIVNVFGTEFPHSLAMVKACENVGILNRVILTIQGIPAKIAEHYEAKLPKRVVNGCTLFDFLKAGSVHKQKRLMQLRGAYGEEAIKLVSHVVGRTEWDRAYCLSVNPTVHYHYCEETLRDSFLKSRWEIDACQKHSLFVSQSHYPLKGFHQLLKAMPEIVKKYPDAVLYTTDSSPFTKNRRSKLTQTYYKKYIRRLIEKYRLRDKVIFLGPLSEEAMLDRYLKSNVFICPSSIENSSNSIAEAMILGVPVVASDVGGVRSILDDKKDGYLYPFDEPYMIPYYVSKIFDDFEETKQITDSAHKHAARLHDNDTIRNSLFKIYDDVINCD